MSEKKTINKILNYSIAILTPGVLILAYIVINEILNETITWYKLSFALFVFICWGIAFYYYKKLKNKSHDDKNTSSADT
jgi:hypothetical protein